MMLEQPSTTQFTMPFGQDDPYGQSSNHYPGQEPLFSRLSDVEAGTGESYADLQQQLEEVHKQLDVSHKRNLDMEKMLRSLGDKRVELEAELRASVTQRQRDLEAKDDEISRLQAENERLRLVCEQTMDKHRRVERELMNVLQKKYDMVESAKREARRQFAEEERIRSELARQQHRLDRQSRGGAAAQAPTHRASMPAGNPRAVRSSIAARELSDFFGM